MFLCEFEELRSPLRDARTQARASAEASLLLPPLPLPLLLGWSAQLSYLCMPAHCIGPNLPAQGGGVHGNAILTKFDVAEAVVVRHR